MAGFREFQTGEVLTAANVDDFLMKQSVQKYADAAARDAALGTAVAGGNALREGMVAWLDDTDSVIAYDGSAWNPVGAEPPAGIGSNVVSANKTDVFSTTATAYTDVTDLTVTITPTSATSKIMLIAQVNLGAAGESTGLPRVRLNGGNADAHVGDAGGTSTAAGFGSMGTSEHRSYSAGLGISSIIAYLDSPATTSATTYTVQLASSGGGTVRVNQGGAYRSASSITAIEVAA